MGDDRRRCCLDTVIFVVSAWPSLHHHGAMLDRVDLGVYNLAWLYAAENLTRREQLSCVESENVRRG